MSDETTGQPGATPGNGPDPASGATPGGQQETGSGATPEDGSKEGATPDTSLRDSGRVALDKERDARRDAERQLAETRRRINELEDAGKSETERLAAQLQRTAGDLEKRDQRIAELEGQIAHRELVELQRQVAAEFALPATMAARLHGNDLRSLRADAKSMAEELQAGTPAGSIGIGQGGAAAGGTRRVDMNSIIREAAGRG